MPKRSPKYQDDMPSVRLYFWRKWKQGVKQRMKQWEQRIDDRYGNGWHNKLLWSCVIPQGSATVVGRVCDF